MHDLLIRGGTVIDGTGAPGRTADVAISAGHVVAIGADLGPARATLDADGALVTPGFVDVHSHYDGQASWDEEMTPSSIHGATTVAMGSCGVGFAPCHAADRDRLIALMEGVEDIPGTALAEGLTWGWETFPEYMDVLDRRRHTIDLACHVPHDAVRVFAMGARGLAGEVAARVITHDGIDDAVAMASYEALFAGAQARIIVVNDFPLIPELALRLIAAAQRGVRVDVLTGSGLARRGDGTFFDGPRHRELFEYMVKRCYEALLAAGVHVAEYAAPASATITARGGRVRPYVHAKVVVVDGWVASVGTANLDATASHWEREVNLVIESPAVAAALTAQLDAVLADAHAIDPASEEWRREAPRRALASRLWPDRLYS